METIVIRVQKNFLIKFSYTKEFIKIRKGLEMEYLLRTGCRYPELIKKKKKELTMWKKMKPRRIIEKIESLFRRKYGNLKEGQVEDNTWQILWIIRLLCIEIQKMIQSNTNKKVFVYKR